MVESYREQIARLISECPFNIDPKITIAGRAPSLASSEFLTNREQGDWAEQIIYNAINQYCHDYLAVKYGRTENLAAGDEGFEEFYRSYQNELNTIGKKPDLLIFRQADIDGSTLDLDDDALVMKAVAAIEVRSSSFLANRYAEFMTGRTNRALLQCDILRSEILKEPFSTLLKSKRPELHRLLSSATPQTFCELDFHLTSWSSSPDLVRLSQLLKQLKEQMSILHKRQYLSITPKLEDLALVNRWVQRFNVRHYYLQVFFDKAYVIGFKDILEICCDTRKEGDVFVVEKDVKNQGKTTIKINVQVGKEILGKIDMPEHRSKMRELERGRLLFYVTFHGGKGYLDQEVFRRDIVNDG